MKNVSMRSPRPKRERRPSESFFDWTSSEDEDEVEDLPVVRRAKSAQYIRASMVDHGRKTPEKFNTLSSEMTTEEPAQDASDAQNGSLKELGASVPSSSSAQLADTHVMESGNTRTEGTKLQCLSSDELSVMSLPENIKPHDDTGISTDIFQILASGPSVKAVPDTSAAIHKPRRSWRSIFGGREAAKAPTTSLPTCESQRGKPSSAVFANDDLPHTSSDKVRTTVTPVAQIPTQQDPEKLSAADTTADRGESIFIDLGLTNSTLAMCTVQVSLIGDTDDEELFRRLKSAYSEHLLGWSRIGLRCIRRIAYVSLQAGSKRFPDSQGNLFLRNFASPCRARGQTAWISWVTRHGQGITSLDHDPTTKSQTVEFHPLAKGRQDEESGIANCPRLCVKFTHAFNFPGILILFLATWSTVALPIGLWIVFGAPRTYDNPTYMSTGAAEFHTSSEELRIIAGFVLGLLVLLVLTMFDLCLIAGGWILL